MTTPAIELFVHTDCPGEAVLKMLSSKWKPQIIRIAMKGPVRFNTLLRQLPKSNKQAISLALRELEDASILHKDVIRNKPLHIEYSLTDYGRSVVVIYKMAAELSHQHTTLVN